MDHRDLVDQMVVLDRLALVVTLAVLGQWENVAIRAKLVLLELLDHQGLLVYQGVLEFVEVMANLAKLADLE